MRRVHLEVHGVVQGVGFRPFVHTEATRRGLSGWVRNRPDGVAIEVQGPAEAIGSLVRALTSEGPPAARVDRIVSDDVPLAVETDFVIAGSEIGTVLEASLPADLAICRECACEILLPSGRRSGYPFTNCSHCGPRYTIIEALPYDRERTSMCRFAMCRACAAEHADAADRRFHAQPIACPACGPSLRLLAPDGEVTARGAAALDATRAAIAAGRVLAVKGLGGFHLLVDAANAGAVESLRVRKGREEKPFAVMFASLDAVRAQCEVSVTEADALTSAAAPIVLLKRRTCSGVAANVAPGNARLGVLLPYSPLHVLLLEACDGPLVCTSGNRSEEPICTDDGEALARLRGIADGFLVHDRPIVRPVDDSIAQRSGGGMQLLRRSRGYVPTAIPLLEAASGGRSAHVLAAGGHLKNTVAVAFGGRIVLSQHLGDLTSPEAVAAQERTAADLVRFFDVHPTLVACDLHPDYASTRLAERLAASWGARLERVQHHHAHVAACAAEHGICDPILGLAWDGAGLGANGVTWGGEALWVEREKWHRVAHLRPFSLPGGEAAMREPRRAALGLLHAIGEPLPDSLIDAFTAREAAGLTAMLDSGVRCPPTTSIGRLFDAVSSLLGLRQRASFEGQAAMDLEWLAAGAAHAAPYSLPLDGGEPAIADWEPCLRAVLEDRRRGEDVAKIAARFHATLAELALAIAERAGLPRVALTGGCFQNTLLTRLVADRLRRRGFDVLTAQRVPPNDGGLAFGQAAVALWRGLGQKD